MIKAFVCMLALALSLFIVACEPLFVPDAPPAVSPTPTHVRQAPAAHIYIVRDRDTLESIAIALHIRGGWQALYNANKAQIDATWTGSGVGGQDPQNHLWPGQKLRIP